MSDANLRSRLIRLAHTNPEIRDQILPLLKTAKKFPNVVRDIEDDYKRKAITSGEKSELLDAVEDAETERDAAKIVQEHRKGRTASRNDVMDSVLPMRDVAKLHRKMEEQDEQSAKLLLDVYNALRERLSLSDGEMEALNRVTNMVKSGQNWDADLLRNNIFKAANSLGMKLPSFMF
ncbi:MAG: hypothetical protein E4G90_10525 [Gemmatimonadales bacterium]|nr:MAG: hypothetical protein E4G90_10525 [Gemmatimonadales bacterium]